MIRDLEPYLHKKVVIFDLDGTLAESRQPIDQEMFYLLSELLIHYKVAVISGGAIEQYKKQFLPRFADSPHLLNDLILLPTSGSSLYYFKDEQLIEGYSNTLSTEQTALITETLKNVLAHHSLPTETEHGSTIQNRGTQITYSALGHGAPLEKKSEWDPDQKKRQILAHELSKLLPDFDILIGGTTSIDITKKGINKAYGVRKLADFLNIPIAEMLFVGDALFEGGNDDSVRETNIDCIKVDDINDTKQLIRSLINPQTI